MITNSTKMAEIRYSGRDLPSCANAKCRKLVPEQELCFLDTLWDRIYCYACGLCLRFARKRAMQRGEPIEGVEA